MRYLMFLQLFAHAHQERWSSLVDAKLRQSLVTRDNYIFNTNYEGTPTAGKVKIPVLLCQAGRDTMVRAEGQEYFAKNSGNTRIVRFPDSKHELFTATYDIMLPYYEEVFDFYAEK